MDTRRATAEEKKHVRDAEKVISRKTAKSMYTNAPTAETIMRHGILIAHGEERRIIALMD